MFPSEFLLELFPIIKEKKKNLTSEPPMRGTSIVGIITVVPKDSI